MDIDGVINRESDEQGRFIGVAVSMESAQNSRQGPDPTRTAPSEGARPLNSDNLGATLKRITLDLEEIADVTGVALIHN
ncbi:hypothetical protein ACGF3J_25880 [Streptomyces sp. NPDC048171]|uniref:hypothetical protein n=1 Tax=unclassified Streptomyces TaxID=2593676 RepID=UPI00137190C9|nr:hypothetical protein [Streptomyces sp. SID5789]MZE70146.1 hypothetical protein [Streptomyces sp. SID5789]